MLLALNAPDPPSPIPDGGQKTGFTQARSTPDKARIRFLDGMRGIAISAVVLFHAYARWPDIMPYKARFADVFVFKYGWLGVELFFMISGFVILMTIRKCHNFTDFMIRRWSRLFPAMLLCSAFILISAKLLPQLFNARPGGAVNLLQLVPGLTFIEPNVIKALIGIDTGQLEGAFWSLYVEVNFYVIFGLVFYFSGETISVIILSMLGVMAGIALYFHIDSMITFVKVTDIIYFPWFASGALAFKYTQAPRMILIAGIVVMTSLAIYTVSYAWPVAIAASVIAITFYAPIFFHSLRPLYEKQAVLFLGFISYPLYLVHENMMVALTIKLRAFPNAFGGVLMPVIPILIVIGIGYLVAQYGESSLRRQLASFQLRLRTTFGIT